MCIKGSSACVHEPVCELDDYRCVYCIVKEVCVCFCEGELKAMSSVCVRMCSG